MRSRWTVVLVVLGTALLLGSCSGGGGSTTTIPEYSPTPSASKNPGGGQSPSASPTKLLQVNPEFEVPEITQDGVRGKVLKAFWDYFRVSVAAQDKMDPTLLRYHSVMTGQALKAHLDQIRRLNKKGLEAYGAPKITDVQILKLKPKANPPFAIVGACIDDENWTALKAPAPPEPGSDTDFARVGVAKYRGVWKVYAHAHEKRDEGKCKQ